MPSQTTTPRLTERFDEALWQRFSQHDPHDHLWYYTSLLEIFKTRNSTWLVDELDRVVTELTDRVAASANA